MDCWMRFIDWCQRPSMIKIRMFKPRNVMVLVTFSIILASSIALGVWRYHVVSVPTNADNLWEPSSGREKSDYQIWIGARGQDLVLQSYGDPPKDYIVVENVGYCGDWLPRPAKITKYTDIEALTIGPNKREGEYCGTYDIHKQDLTYALFAYGFYPINDKDVRLVYITHGPCVHSPRLGTRPSEESDWWHIVIKWEVGILEILNESDPPFIITHKLVLSGYTNRNAAWEGVYDETADTWTVTFNNAEFELYENTSGSFSLTTGSGLNKLWEGQLSFTVEIQRILPN